MTNTGNGGEVAAGGNQPSESRWQRWRRVAGERWEERPSLSELQYYYLPMALVVGSVAVGTVDEAFDLHLAEHMAHVQTDPGDNIVVRTIEDVVREIGERALEVERGDTQG